MVKKRSKSQRDLSTCYEISDKLIKKSSNREFEIKKYEDGLYEGEICNGLRHGKGKCSSRNSIFEGEWIDNQPSGYGIKIFHDSGDRHEGYYLAGKREGWGMYQWSNGDKYHGNWSCGLMNGKGVFTWSTGDVYSGEWKSGIICGFGCKTHSLEGFTEGHFVDGKIHGWARREFICGDRYIGQHHLDCRSGWGEYIWHDGTSYRGQWKRDKMNGYGVHAYPNHDPYQSDLTAPSRLYSDFEILRYSGNFVDGRRHGQGMAKFSNGDSYEGAWVDGQPSGWGIYKYKLLELVYSGEFLDGKRHGFGNFCSMHYKRRPSLQIANSVYNFDGFYIDSNPIAAEFLAMADVLVETEDELNIGDLDEEQTNHLIHLYKKNEIESLVLSTQASFSGLWFEDKPQGGMLELSNGIIVNSTYEQEGI